MREVFESTDSFFLSRDCARSIFIPIDKKGTSLLTLCFSRPRPNPLLPTRTGGGSKAPVLAGTTAGTTSPSPSHRSLPLYRSAPASSYWPTGPAGTTATHTRGRPSTGGAIGGGIVGWGGGGSTGAAPMWSPSLTVAAPGRPRTISSIPRLVLGDSAVPAVRQYTFQQDDSMVNIVDHCAEMR